mmetsp:Transcript_15250/g.21016  ORF Transcript_15250/g.21016 Transcript_15250/m.21016 type:complete len:256 (-) Transcript_15250:45-812(-)|eukprot:CAMPEP_0194579004 /NCGR_PEP_ID=MMETSP0292-20121207/13220_1 /TAXON_ID=39354 /ORGANISM="Heterosigma akashiwo, Strain CCMP2393" /LENGTH=255 /DNA_ID=CAMNT_0039431821 /DNA_START=74 /DNA_END=841 /DNA_ORIENTATION=-
MQALSKSANVRTAATKLSPVWFFDPRNALNGILLRQFSSEGGELTEEQQLALVKAKMEKTLQASQKNVSPWTVSDLTHIRTSDLPANPAEIASLDGMLAKQAARTVYIRQKQQNAMTSGMENTKTWVLGWKQGTRWSNPLMGWTSTDDPMSNLEMRFESEEQAVTFCNKMGWKHIVAPERHLSGRRARVVGQNTYSHNFLPPCIEHDLKLKGKKTQVFERDGKDASHFHKFLKYHGDGDVGQHGPNPGGVKQQAS